ncbi:putative disease resistance protein [Camellia lanceoleosa]|nr:putative disease resistance protein [Camellia lanceoleosa]
MDVFSRAGLGKVVTEKIQEVEKLQENGSFSNGLLIEDSTSGQFIPTIGSFGETASARNKEKVWNCLMNDEVRRIGVFGMGGVGKSTIMYHIDNQLVNETYNFDDVIWVTVSKAFNISKLQSEIAITLDLDLSKYEDETRRASKLHKMPSQRKRYVLILDDLWESFSLEKVGIPEPTRDNGCKLVLTTRSSEVYRRMECREIKVELLTEEETLNLFMTKAKEHQIVLAPKVKEIATKVAKECARQPFAIITIAGSMKGVNDIHKWRNALNELISSTKEIWDDDSVVFEQLKFSYSRLKDEKIQHYFLYCALYPEDHRIFREELIGYWIAKGLIVEMKSIEAMFDKGHTILDKLISTCLLESPTNINDQGQYVTMHDLIREMALKITSTNPQFMIQVGEGLVRVPYEDWSYNVERVSFVQHDRRTSF